MADNSYKLEFTLSNGHIINAGTIVAPQGEAGKNGVTFIPSVSEAGVLSWTNDGGLANPDPVNIKGDAAVITESDVAGWGFTKNAGTITEIKMNGSSKGTSGVVDLGTVLTEHQSLENYVTLDGTQNITGKKTVIPPTNKDNSNQIATTAWAGRRYKSIADFGFTSQTTVKAIVQKIIDNWYEYCTFACTNDNFNNFSDTPDGYGTLIIEVGSNALRPFISFTKQIGDSNSYKHWQANIVRGENNQVSEIQWYEIINSNLPQTISGAKTFTNNIVCSKNYPIIDLRHTLLTHGAYPSETRSNEIRVLDKDGYYEGGIRFDTYTDGTQELKIMSRSFGTTYISGVILRAKNKASSADEGGAWILHPVTDGSMDFGASSKRWRNGYITNLQLCKVINGGGGNSLIQQNSDTSGADITVGSNNCPLKLQGKNARPVYRQGKGSYNNIALQSDIPKLQWVTPTSTDEIVSALMWRVNGDSITHTSGMITLNGMGSGQYGFSYSSDGPLSLYVSGNKVYMDAPNFSKNGSLHLSYWKILKYA